MGKTPLQVHKDAAQNNTINDLCRYLLNASKESCLPQKTSYLGHRRPKVTLP